jgi:hypothetical protein
MAARLMGNRRNVQQEIGGAAECRVDHHGVFNRAIGEDILRRDALLAQQQRGRADALAISVQTGSPDGASAE